MRSLVGNVQNGAWRCPGLVILKNYVTEILFAVAAVLCLGEVSPAGSELQPLFFSIAVG